MAQISLYVPENVPRDFLDSIDSFIKIVPEPLDPYALFDRTDTCACSTRNFLAIRGRCITMKRSEHALLGYPCYALPPDCTFKEAFVVATWILRRRFKSFQRCILDGSLYRHLNGNDCFIKEETFSCCDTQILDRDPVFMLKNIVVSPFGKGPTLESVLPATNQAL